MWTYTHWIIFIFGTHPPRLTFSFTSAFTFSLPGKFSRKVTFCFFCLVSPVLSKQRRRVHYSHHFVSLPDSLIPGISTCLLKRSSWKLPHLMNITVWRCIVRTLRASLDICWRTQQLSFSQVCTWDWNNFFVKLAGGKKVVATCRVKEKEKRSLMGGKILPTANIIKGFVFSLSV